MKIMVDALELAKFLAHEFSECNEIDKTSLIKAMAEFSAERLISDAFAPILEDLSVGANHSCPRYQDEYPNCVGCSNLRACGSFSACECPHIRSTLECKRHIPQEGILSSSADLALGKL